MVALPSLRDRPKRDAASKPTPLKLEGKSRPARRRLELLTAEDRPVSGRLIGELREVRRIDEVPAFSIFLELVTHLDRDEEEAEQLVLETLRHRDDLTHGLGRDPGLRVAALDLLSNVKGVLTSPAILESAELQRIERSATTDALTGLFNRRHFHATLRFEISRSERYGLKLALLLLDLDAFKQVNDVHGHPLGDVVLQRVGRTLRRAVRDSDVACRYGGEEFAVILPETSRLGAFALGERIRRQIEQDSVPTADGQRAGTTVSGGIASLPEDGDDAGTLLERADEALYLAKRSGRNRVVMYYAERRSAVRYSVRAGAVVTVIAGSDDGERSARAIDLSSSGALLEVGGTPLPSRTAVQVRFGGSDVAGTRRGWTFAGTVVRMEPIAAGARIAVAFREQVPTECLVKQLPAGSL
jgi:diguanylate cyclase (GGDEF)-like protein